MRTMLKVNMCTETANDLARQGRLGETIRSILDDLKPEAAYFADDNGERTGFIFFDLADPSQIPAVGRALVPCSECQGLVPPGHEHARSGQSNSRHRACREEIRRAHITPAVCSVCSERS